MDSTFLVIGLGNPGQEYKGTRHNVGFHVIDKLAENFSIQLTPQKSCFAQVGKIRLDDVSLIIAQPTTFMNRSGQAVYALLRWYNILPTQCIVVTDNVDLNAGTLRAKKKGSGGTHNGIRSIQSHVKTLPNGMEYVRIYVGVGSPRPNQGLAQYVLEKWHKSEDAVFSQAFENAASSIVLACKEMPVKGMPVKEMPVKGMPVKEMPVKEMPVKEMPVKEMPVKEQSTHSDKHLQELLTKHISCV